MHIFLTVSLTNGPICNINYRLNSRISDFSDLMISGNHVTTKSLIDFKYLQDACLISCWSLPRAFDDRKGNPKLTSRDTFHLKPENGRQSPRETRINCDNGTFQRMISLGLRKIPHDKNRYHKKNIYHCSHSFHHKPIINTPITTRPFALCFNCTLPVPWLYFSGMNHLDRMTQCKQDLSHIECAAKWFIMIPCKNDFSLHKHESSLPILKFKSAIKSSLAHNSGIHFFPLETFFPLKNTRAPFCERRSLVKEHGKTHPLLPKFRKLKKVAVTTRADLEESLKWFLIILNEVKKLFSIDRCSSIGKGFQSSATCTKLHVSRVRS